MKVELTYGDRCIIARNENEISELREVIRRTNKAIKEIKKQNRKIKWRFKLWDK